MQEPEKEPGPLQLLRQPDFLRAWLAGAMAGIMRWLDMLAVALYVLDITDSPLSVALALFVRMVPMFLFGAVAGAVAEKVDRRKLLIGSLLFLTLVYCVLAWLAWNEALQLWQLGIGVFLSGVFWTLELPIRRTMVAELAGIQNIGATMGLDSSTNNFTRMIGPFTGGFLYEFFGLPGTLMLGAGLFVSAAFLLMSVHYDTVRSPGAGSTILQNLLEGLRFARDNKTVRATLMVTTCLNLFGFSFVSMIPVIAREQLGLSPFPTGILMSADGCGAFIGALLIAFFAHPRRFHQIFLGGATLYLCCIMVFAFSGQFWFSLPALWLGGFGMSGFAAMQSAMVIASSPPEMRNRAMGVLVMCIGLSPFGILMVGFLADWLGAHIAIRFTSAVGLLGMAGFALGWPEMRKAGKSQGSI